jgi:2-keto-4-pentenoate hydratase/2-oxohepta-3-ene-1,7-dioic acid hydratase in catechol pathway
MTRWCRSVVDGRPQVGCWEGDVVRPVSVAGSPLRDLERIVTGEVGGDAIDLGVAVADESLQLLEPLGWYPRNLFCIGKNYREHAAEFSSSGYDASAAGHDDVVPTHPVVFTKPASSVIGPGDVIDRHADDTSQLDYEAELAVVIGSGGRRIAVSEAMSKVFGYTIINDVTARDLQRQHRQWFLGKGLDGSSPVGPSVVTADELDLATAVIECRVNGELRQKASVADLIFHVPTLIATISAVIALMPGDVIATGTPAGVGIGFSPPRFLQTGDEVSITVEPIGTITNRVG